MERLQTTPYGTKPRSRHIWGSFRFLILSIASHLLLVDRYFAYVGPGAGFVFVSSFFVLILTFFLALFYLISWPVRLTWRSIIRKGARVRRNAIAKRVVVIGLDGMDPRLAEKFMGKGKMPNFQRLKDEGAYVPLATTYPSISPSAWSAFSTGVDASHHNIFDFITRDPCSYQPVLSSAEIGKASRILPIGKYLIPLGKPRIVSYQKSKSFWKVLGERGIFSSILRVPITFPPEKFKGVLLSGMCVPDLKGSQGTFSFYTSDRNDLRGETGGVRYWVALQDDAIYTNLHGPSNDLVKGSGELKIPLIITLDRNRNKAQIRVSEQEFELSLGSYSPWIRVVFRPGLGMKVYGICLFYLLRLSPHFELYVSPIHIDPENPALPISYPFIYSIYLAKLQGPYGTLGLAEDTWALNERVIDETAFLQQAYLLHEEREKMLFQALKTTTSGACVCVFDAPDRIQHMFFRCLDENHPSNRDKETVKYRSVIEDLYLRMDSLIGRVLAQLDGNTVLMVLSDHGFTQFRRGVNLNSWFLQNGYLALKDGVTSSGDWFKGVDWDNTRAFSLGLTGIFINRKGRESRGMVAEGVELTRLKKELISKLTGLVDSETGSTAIVEVVDVEHHFSGPYTFDAPDLLIGYNHGYRNSWACATGRVTDRVFEDNLKHWSGDHCVAPKLVPGVLFVNRKINSPSPEMTDIAPTILKLLGVDVPAYMKGKVLV